jgi:hypothetical protein
MKNPLKLVAVLAIAFVLTGCGTVDAGYNGAKSIGQSAISGVGNVVGSGASDASKTLGVASNAVGTVISGAGKVVGGGLDLAGGLIKGTSDIIAPAAAK